MFSFFGGSGVPHGHELAYAQITSEFDVDDATISTVITGLTFTFTPVSGTKYYLEFYADSVEENIGTDVGDVMLIRLKLDGTVVGQGFGINGHGGIGAAIYVKSSTLIGDNTSHIVTADVRNRTTGTNGAIVDALVTSPAYIRAVRL